MLETKNNTNIKYPDKLHPLLIRIPWACMAVILFCLTIVYLAWPELNNTITGILISVTTDIWIPLAWLLAAFGFGITITKIITKKNTDLLPIPAAIGIAFMLWLDHLLGLMGLLQIYNGTIAWLIIIIGLILLYIVKAGNSSFLNLNNYKSISIPNLILYYAWIPPVVVLTVAALSAPGWLWDSEFFGFDVLEYHLQIPHEWFKQGYISPFNHNVYSYLPSYVESAYYHLAVLYKPFADTFRGDAPIRAAIACQLLHAMITLTTALAIGSLLLRITNNDENNNKNKNRLIATYAAGILISTPWIIVTGSMAYNEMPAILMLIAALTIIFKTRKTNVSEPKPLTFMSAVIIGFLLGIACAAKLTSFGLIAVPATIILFIYTPRTKLSKYLIIITGITLGAIIALAPYLIRNAIYSANPVFPFASNIFGSGHWTTEQISRWSNAHKPNPQQTTIISKLNALWQQGPLHAQWAALWFISAFTAIPAVINKTTRKTTLLLLLLIILQLIFWLFFTHLQSRFLLPVTVPLTIISALGLYSLLPNNKYTNRNTQHSKTLYITIAVISFIIILSMGLWTIHLFQQQHEGKPTGNIDKLNMITGAGMSADNNKSLSEYNYYVYLNYIMRTSKNKVYFIGISTPFYIFNTPVWHTTWDTSPLGELIRKYPDQPAKWSSDLQNNLNIAYILVDFSELNRLSIKDQWYDPDVNMETLVNMLTKTRAQPVYYWPPQSKSPRYVLYKLKPI